MSLNFVQLSGVYLRRNQSLHKTIRVIEISLWNNRNKRVLISTGRGSYLRRVFTRYVLLNIYLVPNIKHIVNNGLLYAAVCRVEKFE